MEEDEQAQANSDNKNINDDDDDAETADQKDNDPNFTYFPDPDFRSPSFMETIEFWAEYTSIHGVYYVFERGHFAMWYKWIWTAIVLATLGGLIWALHGELHEFLKYKVDSNTKTIIPSSLSFPQVTVCNTNMYDASLQNQTGIQEPQNEEELMRISRPFEGFVLNTQFNDIQYTTQEQLATVWEPVITTFGLCYTFSTDERVFIPGISAGLKFSIWLNQSSYQQSTLLAGIYVMITQKGSPINAQTTGLLVPPGTASYLAVDLLTFEREREDPWRNCDAEGRSTPAYSIEQCREDCVNSATRDKCGCRPIGDTSSYVSNATIGTNATNTNTNTMRYCNSTDAACTATIGDEDLIQCQICSIPPCQEEDYSAHYSAARVAQIAAQRLEQQEGLTSGEFAANLVQVFVNYGSIRYEKTTESKSTGVTDLLSNLGGSFGFFMGISMISILEFFVELGCLRLLPRLWGKNRLYGVGQKQKFD